MQLDDVLGFRAASSDVHARGGRSLWSPIDEIAGAYDISRAHLTKVVNTLTRAGYLTAVRGRSGGLRLAMPPEEINLGRVVRTTEPDFALVECFSTGNQCVITGCCKLQGVLGEALQAFLAVLDRHTLASIALKPRDFPKPARARRLANLPKVLTEAKSADTQSFPGAREMHFMCNSDRAAN